MKLGEVTWPAQEHMAVSDKPAFSLPDMGCRVPSKTDSLVAAEVAAKRSRMEIQMPLTFYIFFGGYCWKIIEKSLEVNLNQRNCT